jgi:WD40 repeat protein
MRHRLAGLPAPINDLAFSPDGHYLAATLSFRGVRVYRSGTWELLGRDEDYGAGSYSADFSRDQRLVTSSDDGHVRLYSVSATGLRLLVKETMASGKLPFTVRFSPDGSRIAVGFDDTPAVNVLHGKTLALVHAPNTGGSKNGDFRKIAWSADGHTLFAGGGHYAEKMIAIRQWPQAGHGPPRDEPVTSNTLMDMRPLPQGGLVFGSFDPAWGMLDAQGRRALLVSGPIADYRNNREGFTVSRDGQAVGFGFKAFGKPPASFDLEGGLMPGSSSRVPLSPPRTSAPGLAITGWVNTPTPRLNGTVLMLRNKETARSLAIAPDGRSFALGADWSLRLLEHDGRPRWEITTPGTAWGVNISGDGRTVVAALGDGTIRWYDANDGHEKLAFFPHADQRRWVAWTPSGYYQASPGGEELIGWHLNNGKEAAADFFPASRFRSRFNRPDVVTRAIAAPNETEALRLADAEAGRKTDIQPVKVQSVLPPVVEILSPTAGTAVATTSVTVRYTTRTPGDAPVTALRARVNGQAVSLPDSRTLGVAAVGNTREVAIPIPADDSEIQLFAENRHGVSTPALLRLTWAGAKPMETMYKPRLYVLSVGVSKYANPAYNLGLAAKDAKDLAAVLQKQKGKLYADVQVRLLTDDKATRDDVVDGLEWLKNQVTARDVGVMFLAGHGVNDNTGKYYFMPHNADPNKLLRTGVPQGDIRDTLNSLAGKAVFFVDTCHSGNALGTARTRSMSSVTDAFVNELTSAENGVVVFTAATGRQLSQERDDWGNGAFTKALVEGLSGRADFQKTGRITHKGLDYYVAERVKELTQGQQSPVSIAPQGITDFPIAVVR